MRFKNIKQNISALMISGIVLSLLVFTGCGGGGGSSDGADDEVFEDIVLTSGKTWTIMYYGDADCNLESALLADIAEMKAGFVDGQNVKLIVLIDRPPTSQVGSGYSANGSILGETGDFSDTRLYEITNGTITRISGSTQFSEITTTSTYEANMGDAETLQKFIKFCKAYSLTTDYALIISNHGGGTKKKSASTDDFSATEESEISKSICWDETSSNDFLYTAEISDVLTSSESVQLLGLDACLMSSVEFAYQFRNESSNTGFKAEIMVASAPTETGYGWQYTNILRRLNSIGGNNGETDKTLGGSELYFDPTTVTPKILGGIIVEEQRDSTTGDSSQSLTCLDLSKIKAVKDAVDVMAVSLVSEKTDLEALRGNYPTANLLHYFDEGDSDEWISYPFFDLYNLSVAINGSGNFSTTIQAYAANVRDDVDALVIYSFANSDFSGFVANKSGVHIFFPDGDVVTTGYTYICWTYQWWYNAMDVTSYGGYGKLTWCIDGATASNSTVENWFELLDSWYDSSNTAAGGLNVYQW